MCNASQMTTHSPVRSISSWAALARRPRLFFPPCDDDSRLRDEDEDSLPPPGVAIARDPLRDDPLLAPPLPLLSGLLSPPASGSRYT